jgi:uncharacterized protein YfdQ (DUF2303 family)
MFDEQALHLIQQTAVDAASERLPPELQSTLAALPNNYTLADLEKYGPLRRRYRGEFQTRQLEQFAHYVIAQKPEHSQVPVFIDDEKMQARAIFDLGTLTQPGHGDHVALLITRPTPDFDALLKADGVTKSQQELIDWCTDWAPNITFHDEENADIDWRVATNALRKVTVSTNTDATSGVSAHGTSRSLAEKVEANADKSLPASISFKCIPYEGLAEIKLTARLTTQLSREKPAFSLRIIRLKATTDLIAKDFMARISDALQESAQIRIGTFKH